MEWWTRIDVMVTIMNVNKRYKMHEIDTMFHFKRRILESNDTMTQSMTDQIIRNSSILEDDQRTSSSLSLTDA
jgi:hypothetical protein